MKMKVRETFEINKPDSIDDISTTAAELLTYTAHFAHVFATEKQ
jgi:hypothetical protein